MGLTLKESQAVTELAERLYSFLPGKPHPYADQDLSFPGVAARLGLARYWRGGSKLPALTALLTATLEVERGQFCPLVVNIVRHGMVYRKTKAPVIRGEMDEINGIIARVGYKIPELHDTGFLDALPRSAAKLASDKGKPDKNTVAALKQKVMDLTGLDPVKRGFAFEDVLKELFDLHRLAARSAFRLIGEQIDGSFELDAETYLVEARWRNEPATQADLLTFFGKVQGKAHWSRGVFISYAGFTEEGLAAFAHGRQTAIVGMDGLDLYHVLSGEIDLRDVLRRKIRRAAETNRTFVPVRELFVRVS